MHRPMRRQAKKNKEQIALYRHFARTNRRLIVEIGQAFALFHQKKKRDI